MGVNLHANQIPSEKVKTEEARKSEPGQGVVFFGGMGGVTSMLFAAKGLVR
jgi:hypothetical protein